MDPFHHCTRQVPELLTRGGDGQADVVVNVHLQQVLQGCRAATVREGQVLGGSLGVLLKLVGREATDWSLSVRCCDVAAGF